MNLCALRSLCLCPSESVCLAKGFIAAQLDLAVEKKRRGNLVNKKDAGQEGDGGK